jgi:hypothetical protein
MTDEDRRTLEGWEGHSGIMMPVDDARALNMFVIHALRDMSSQQRTSNTLIMALQTDVVSMRERMALIAPELETIKRHETEIKELREKEQRRAGMQTLVEWVGKFFPWLAAAAAGLWALKTNTPSV